MKGATAILVGLAVVVAGGAVVYAMTRKAGGGGGGGTTTIVVPAAGAGAPPPAQQGTQWSDAAIAGITGLFGYLQSTEGEDKDSTDDARKQTAGSETIDS